MATKCEYTFSVDYNSLAIYGPAIDLLEGEPWLAQVYKLRLEKPEKVVLDFSMFPNLRKLSISSKKDYQLPQTLANLPFLQELHTNITLAENMDDFSALKKVSLGSNSIITMSEKSAQSLARSPKLTSLKLQYFDKEYPPIKAPDWLWKLLSLKVLSLQLCRFTEIPQEINQLIHLEELNLNCAFSELSYIPKFDKLVNLKRLEVRGETVQGQKRPPYHLFAELIENIQPLTNLLFLDLFEWYPKLKKEWLAEEEGRYSIPDSFSNFQKLEELCIAGMKLDYFPLLYWL